MYYPLLHWKLQISPILMCLARRNFIQICLLNQINVQLCNQIPGNKKNFHSPFKETDSPRHWCNTINTAGKRNVSLHIKQQLDAHIHGSRSLKGLFLFWCNKICGWWPLSFACLAYCKRCAMRGRVTELRWWREYVSGRNIFKLIW